MIATVFGCAENSELIKILRKKDVDVRITSENDVNKRFLDTVDREEGEYVIRIGGDQCLLDYINMICIVEKMYENGDEWFYNAACNCVLPDVINVRLIKKYKAELVQGKRYFDILEMKDEIKRYTLPYSPLLMFNFRANCNEGFRICRHVIRENLDIYKVSEVLQQSLINSSYLRDSGLLGSWILPVGNDEFYYDEKGNVNPWLGKSVVDFIRKRLNKSLRVFEWGCGNSTLFWSTNVKEVVSVENNEKWYEKMLNMVPQNVRLEFCALEYGGEYCKAILKEEGLFDIVLIDGRDRVRCAKNAISKLKSGGILIWDDSDRGYYEEGDIFLKEHGFKKIEISSIIYAIPGFEAFTAIYYRNENIFYL